MYTYVLMAQFNKRQTMVGSGRLQAVSFESMNSIVSRKKELVQQRTFKKKKSRTVRKGVM